MTEYIATIKINSKSCMQEGRFHAQNHYFLRHSLGHVIYPTNTCFADGDGRMVKFWEHMWCGDVSFRDAFLSIYSLACDRDASVPYSLGYSSTKGCARLGRGGFDGLVLNCL